MFDKIFGWFMVIMTILAFTGCVYNQWQYRTGQLCITGFECPGDPDEIRYYHN